jgi:2-oxoisovalerate dehydrogenase E1 component
MAVQTKIEQYCGLDREAMIGLYRNIYMARRIDDKEIQLKRQNKIFFQLSGAGHEAVTAAAALVLRPGYDWFFPHYRDRALCLGLGVTPLDMLLQSTGAAADPASGGRQMPNHWASTRLNIVTRSSPTGTQFLPAAGCAEAALHAEQIGHPQDLISSYHPDAIVYVASGEGTTSEGEFFESLNSACNLKLPLLYLIEDNGYAISVPVEVQTAGGSISKLVASFPNLFIQEVDGCDPLRSYDVLRRAADYCRQRKGPAMVHAHVIRPYSHSLSDDEILYRPKPERDAEAARDPVTWFAVFLIGEGLLTAEQLDVLKQEVDGVVSRAAEEAVAAPKPAPETALRYIYSPDVDPTSAEFDTESQQASEGKLVTMVDTINACLRDEMERNEHIMVFGEDVADCSREDNLGSVKGKGGVFKVTHNLQRRFGAARVFNTPLAEASIIGRAIGLSVRGFKPVPEIQFLDYIWPAMHQLRNEVSLYRWRSNNLFKCPMVIRVATGGYLTGGAIYHSQCGEVMFTHIPGLRVVMPSNAVDANGLLRTALRSDDPVMFLEHKHLYRQTYNKGVCPGPDFMIPFGKARVVRAGSDVSIITYGATVQRSVVAARMIEEEHGISTEIVDLRTLSPYDWEAIAQSVSKTSKALVVYEDTKSWGYGAEIAARISDELFESLDAPVRRVAALDSFVAYSPPLEDEILPQVSDIAAGILALVRY